MVSVVQVVVLAGGEGDDDGVSGVGDDHGVHGVRLVHGMGGVQGDGGDGVSLTVKIQSRFCQFVALPVTP